MPSAKRSSFGNPFTRFLARFQRVTQLMWTLDSVRFFPFWDPTAVNQIHGLIELVLDIKSRTTKHAIWVECGSLHGESATLMLAFPFIEKMHCIDIFQSQILSRRLKPMLESGRCVFHHGTSRQCEAMIPEVHVAYIDANHAYDAVKDDIAVWYPRVAAGGALCGHDYHASGSTWPGVRKAVDEFVAQHQLSLHTYPDSSWMVLKKS